jgi:hypothetical protein
MFTTVSLRGGVLTAACLVSLLNHTPTYAATLEQEQQALNIIAEFADKFCKDINQQGGSHKLEVTGDAKAKLTGVVKQLADLGFEGAAKYNSQNYEGLLQTDLLAALKDNNSCRLQIWNDLKGKLLEAPTFQKPLTSKTKLPSVDVGLLQKEQQAFASPSSMDINYKIETHANEQTISPEVGYLNLVRSGGPIPPVRFTWTPFKFAFPTLDIKVVNNTGETIFIEEAQISVEHSELDPEPVLLVLLDPDRLNARHVRILNEGWGAASNVRISFHLDPWKPDSKPRFDEPFEYSVTTPDIDNKVNVDISDAFAKAGVDTKSVDHLAIRRMTTDGGRPDTVTVAGEGGGEVTMTADAYAKKRVSILGPFEKYAGALVSGDISYRGSPEKTSGQSSQVRFSTLVWLYNENLPGVPAPPSFAYTTKLEVDGANYVRKVGMSQEVKTGETDRFTLKIGVEKSSIHVFKLRFRYNGSKVLDAGTFRMTIFVPRSSAEFLISQSAQASPD